MNLAEARFPFVNADLPYNSKHLEPHISANTLAFHHGKHHQAYVNKANDLLEGSHLRDATLVEILKQADGPLFNNVAQHYNHWLFWNSMHPDGGDKMLTSRLRKDLERDFGSIESLKSQFCDTGMGQFGSGWVWLTLKNGTFHLLKTSNADTPLIDEEHKVLATCDVWEHAYYLDYQNRRNAYLEVFFHQLMNWQAVEEAAY